jgi:hypothetical protein
MEKEQKKKRFPALPASDNEDENPKLKPKKEYEYHHRVESCPCGNCWLSRYHRATWKN